MADMTIVSHFEESSIGNKLGWYGEDDRESSRPSKAWGKNAKTTPLKPASTSFFMNTCFNFGF